MTERDDDPVWLDRVLDAAPKVEPSAALRRAVAEIPLRHPHAQPGMWGARFVLRAALAGALLATLAGALVGSYSDALDQAVVSLASEESDGPWQDMAVLAFADDLDAELEP